MLDLSKNRYRLRIVIPAYPAFNIYSRIARRTTALGPVCVADTRGASFAATVRAEGLGSQPPVLPCPAR